MTLTAFILGYFQAHDERNYHIFYCMIQGLSADQLNQLELKDATSYHYLTQVRILSSLVCHNRASRNALLE